MNVMFSEGVRLFQAIGVAAKSWPVDRMQQKFLELPKFLEEIKFDKAILPAVERENLEDILAGLERGGITVVDDKEEKFHPPPSKDEDVPTRSSKATKGGLEDEPKTKKKDKTVATKTPDKSSKKSKDKEVPDKKTKPDKKSSPGKGKEVPAPAPRKLSTRAAAPGKPGVVMSIVEFLKKATSSKPLTKEEVLDKLCGRFPERPRSSMNATVNSHVPNWIFRTKGIVITPIVKKDGRKGYFIDPDQGAVKKAEDRAAHMGGVPNKSKAAKQAEKEAKASKGKPSANSKPPSKGKEKEVAAKGKKPVKSKK